MKVDLHVHTNYSDGVFSPEKVVDLALEYGLEAFAITDHDNILAYDVAKSYTKKLACEGKKYPEIIRGIEVNTIYNDREIHILGYFMDVENADFKEMVYKQQQARIKQAIEIIELLRKKEGIKIDFERDVKTLVAQGGSIGRPHLARAVINVKKANSITDAYEKFINRKSSVYVQRKTVSPHEAVEIIAEAKGIPVFAHPIDVDIAEDLIKELVNYGLRGVETYHRKHSPAAVEHFSTIAESLGLIKTGGSDFHSPNILTGKILLGQSFIPEWIYDELLKEKRRVELS